MATIDLSRLSIPELEQLQKDAGKRIDEMRDEQTRAARAEIEQLADKLAEKHGIPKSQLLGGTAKAGHRKGGKIAAKYRNPNGSETWAGRGRKPAWVQEHLARGGTLEQLAVR